MREDQNTIGQWADDTFGEVVGNGKIVNESISEAVRTLRLAQHAERQMGGLGRGEAATAVRALREVAELVEAIATGASEETIIKEVADTIIVLYRLGWTLKRDIHEAIDNKMLVNRGRTWERDGTGHGFHVKPNMQDMP